MDVKAVLGSAGRSAAIGGVAGMRTMLPAFMLRRHTRNLPSLALAAGALGELVGDKLPFTPSRLSRPQLVARLTAGAAAGRTIATRGGTSGVVGAAAGAAGAYVMAHAAYYARKAIVARTKLPDPAVALVEDALAIGCALALTPRPKPQSSDANGRAPEAAG